MEKALAIFEKTEEGTKAVFLDQDTIECAQLNLRTKKRVAAIQEAQSKAERMIRKAELEKAKFKDYTKKTIAVVAGDCAAVVGFLLAGSAALIHPVIFIPATVIFLCAACVRLGTWFGKAVKE